MSSKILACARAQVDRLLVYISFPTYKILLLIILNVNLFFLDIDECENREDNSCYGVCRNLPGTFQCQCPHGTYGSPWMKGGCGNGASIGNKPLCTYSIYSFFYNALVVLFLYVLHKIYYNLISL